MWEGDREEDTDFTRGYEKDSLLIGLRIPQETGLF